MALTVSQLLAPTTPDESLASILTLLTSIGFPATSWQSGSVPRTLVELAAHLHAETLMTITLITRGRFNGEATGDWLTLLADDVFDNQRIDAVKAEFSAQLVDTVGAGPYTLDVEQLVATDDEGHTYRNAAGGALAANGTLTLRFVAEFAGAASNPHGAITLSTPLAGVTLTVVSLPPPTLGVDAELDAKLRTRNATKWPTRAYPAPAEAYKYWALTASAAVTRVFPDDQNPRGPGTVDLYIAGVDGGLPDSEVSAVLGYIIGTSDGVCRRPLGANLRVLSAVNKTPSPVVEANVYYDSAYTQAQLQQAISASLNTLFDTVDIGGTRGSSGSGSILYQDIYRAIVIVPGVAQATVTTPDPSSGTRGNIALLPVEVATPVITLHFFAA